MSFDKLYLKVETVLVLQCLPPSKTKAAPLAKDLVIQRSSLRSLPGLLADNSKNFWGSHDILKHRDERFVIKMGLLESNVINATMNMTLMTY